MPDEVTVYGIWNCTDDRWVVMASCEVFHTIYLAVAKAQLHYLNQFFGDDYEILPLSDGE